MASDSIIARPTNMVRVMAAEATGCCANDARAVATALPSPSAGAMQPIPIVMPAVTIDASAMRVVLSIEISFCAVWQLRAGSGRCIDSGKNAENIGLNHAGQQAERGHDDGKQERRDRQQDAYDNDAAHHVAEQANGQCQRARNLADEIERQHEKRRLRVSLE